MIIYQTTNLLNGKIYVGQDAKDNPNYYGSGIILERSIKKYGISNFKKDIIERCKSKKELDIRENVNSRSSDLLKKVFAKQDKK